DGYVCPPESPLRGCRARDDRLKEDHRADRGGGITSRRPLAGMRGAPPTARPGRATGTVAARPRGGRITSSDEHRTISARQYRRILCHTLINEVVSETA
ncbi:TPA: hypothetical protein O7W61_RS28455, partial [Escherichia coli]|uniref:hypothetical protein n=1 Tax=Escherichia coli TaxID=562 RepID=UPI00237B3272